MFTTSHFIIYIPVFENLRKKIRNFEKKYFFDISNFFEHPKWHHIFFKYSEMDHPGSYNDAFFLNPTSPSRHKVEFTLEKPVNSTLLQRADMGLKKCVDKVMLGQNEE